MLATALPFPFTTIPTIVMFKMISWPQYLGAVVLLLVVYYAYVAVVYYRSELTALATGKGKLVAATAGQAATPTSLLTNGPLIPKSAIVLPIVAEQNSEPELAEGEETQEEEEADDNPNTMVVESPIEEVDESSDSEEEIPSELDDEEISSSTVEAGTTAAVSVEASAGAENEESEMDFTVGVAQLNNYFDRAATGEITQEQLEKEVPALENTDLLVAFFKKSTRAAQELTSKVYAEVAEPAIG